VGIDRNLENELIKDIMQNKGHGLVYIAQLITILTSNFLLNYFTFVGKHIHDMCIKLIIFYAHYTTLVHYSLDTLLKLK